MIGILENNITWKSPPYGKLRTSFDYNSSYLNEPHVNGGSSIASNGNVMLNDMLGTTVGSSQDGVYSTTAFGETDNEEFFYTGKPQIGELGYAFLFRNYRPDQGKWQTTDPLGYPDGWNNFAYVNNWIVHTVDPLGLEYYQLTLNLSAIAGGGSQGNCGFTYDPVTGNIGLTGGLGGGTGCNISASIALTVNEGSPAGSSQIVTTEGGGGPLGYGGLSVTTDLEGNVGGGASGGLSLTPVLGSVSITQQGNVTIFNTNHITDAIDATYDVVDGWLTNFMYDLFYRSGNDPIVSPVNPE